MTRLAAGSRFRTRKLSTKQTLAVLRENQIDSVDDDGQRNIPQIETGVERQEEIEHHLQAAISAHQAAAAGSKESEKAFIIPTPNTTELSVEHYARLYPKRFEQPISYIRFSDTVEDCCGIQYCLTDADTKHLAKLNASRKPGLPPINEDDFETVMDLYESTIQQNQPFLSMDVSNILPYEELEPAFEDALDSELKVLAKWVYSYWKEQKIARGGRPIVPVLKFEQGNEKDDGDPYVCFRRRDVRQVRKTRRTDSQSTDKLKKIRQDFETARGLIKDVLQREQMRKTAFLLEKQIFEQRRTAIELKRKLNIKDTDEDLINKPKRLRQNEPTVPTSLRIPLRQDGKPPDADLRHLSLMRAEDEKRRLEKFNQLRKARPAPRFTMVDLTHGALFKQTTSEPTYPLSNYCSVQTYYLPSPPPSAHEGLSSPEYESSPPSSQRQVTIIQASPTKPVPRNAPMYRRRRGRGGRVTIDRLGWPRTDSALSADADPLVLDRFKFDRHGDDHDKKSVVFPVDPYNDRHILFRARMMSPPPESVPLIQISQPLTQPRRPNIINANSPVGSNFLLQNYAMQHGINVPQNVLSQNGMQVNGHGTASFSVPSLPRSR